MKGIYLTSYDLKDQSDGVVKKILSQIECFKRAGINMRIIDRNCFPETFKLRIKIMNIISTTYITDFLYQYMVSNINLQEIDFIYIRKGFSNMIQINSLAKVKEINPKITILMEIATYPYDEEFGGRRKLVTIPRDKKARKFLKKYVDRIVTYSKDKEIFGVKTINISNGIDYNRIQLKNNIEHQGVHLIAVAFFDYWHGYDRLINGMAKDIDLVKDNKVVFHLVGNGRAVDEYRQLVEKQGLKDWVIFHGRTFGDELRKIYDQCDIGIDTLGRHRAGVYYNSTLKGKEYCAVGLPIISGVETELDEMGYPFYYRVPADESLVLINDVIEFYKKMYENKKAEEVNLYIRETTMPKFNFYHTFNPIISYIKNR